MIENAFTKIELSASLAGEDGQWKISLIGKNIINKTTINYEGTASIYTGSYWSNVDVPRQIFLTAEYNWY